MVAASGIVARMAPNQPANSSHGTPSVRDLLSRREVLLALRVALWGALLNAACLTAGGAVLILTASSGKDFSIGGGLLIGGLGAFKTALDFLAASLAAHSR